MSERERYFEGARSWAEDSRIQSARSRRIAWTVAGIACAAALFEAVAIALMLPLKTVQPVTLLVDRQTGFVQALNPLEPRRVGADAALTQSLLAQYVTAREGFDRATVRADYRRVALWSADRARSSYLANMPAANPVSPFQRYPSGTVVTARVKSVSRLQDGVALVRFDTQILDRSGRASPGQPWISVVRFRYSDAPMTFEDRLVNPLGFQVTGYRRDAEAPPPASDGITASAVPAPTAPALASQPGRPTQARPTPAPVAYVTERTRETQTVIAPPPQTAPQAPRRLPRTFNSAGREVPLASLPLGSPLEPFPAPGGQTQPGTQP